MKLTSSAVAAILLLSLSTSALPITGTPEPFVERSIFGSLIGTVAKDGAGDAAKVAGKAASGGVLSHLKNAAITGVEGLVGTEVVSKIADTVDPGLASGSSAVSGAQTNSTDSTVEARSLFGSLVSTVAKDGAKDAAKAAGDVAKAADAKGSVDAANILEKFKKVGKQNAGDLVRVRREPRW
jgi:hypothetical protein